MPLCSLGNFLSDLPPSCPARRQLPAKTDQNCTPAEVRERPENCHRFCRKNVPETINSSFSWNFRQPRWFYGPRFKSPHPLRIFTAKKATKTRNNPQKPSKSPDLDTPTRSNLDNFSRHEPPPPPPLHLIKLPREETSE